jgi:hypothetical protein
MTQEKEVRTKFTTLYIDPTVMKRIMYYTQAADGEVSGLGTLIKDDKGRYVVNKVFLLEQESSGADTELNSESISKLMTDMINKNEDPSTLKFWWHSHANMGVFWSGQDDSCAETLSHEFAFSLVVNKAREMRCRLDLYNPFRITFDGVKVTELVQEDVNLKEECEKEVKEKVKSPGGYWKNWHERDHFYPGNDDGYSVYDDYNGYKKHYRRGFNEFPPKLGYQKSKVKLEESVVNDIEMLIDQAERHNSEGGIFCWSTWNEFILEVLRKVVEERLEKKAACTSTLTYSESWEDCRGKCKVKDKCMFWSKFFDETEEDALVAMNSIGMSPGDDEFINNINPTGE